MEERCIAIDFDGTIAHYNGWIGVNKFGKVIDGCIEALEKIREMGYKIIIYTCRIQTPELEKYLKRNKIPYDAINENIWHEYKQHGDKRKVIADIYIDDRAINFNGNWEETTDKIFNFHNAKEILNNSRIKDTNKIIEILRENNPYSEKTFIEPTKEEWDRLNKTLNEKGMKCLDGYSGSIGRLAWNNCCDKLEEILKGE